MDQWWAEYRRKNSDRLWRTAREVSHQLAEAGARLVIVFGSLAKGRPAATSDVDIAAVFPDATLAGTRMHERPSRLKIRPGKEAPLDLLIYSESEWAKIADRPFGRNIWEKGVATHGRIGRGGTLV